MSWPHLRFEPVPADAGGAVDAGGVVGAVKVGGADGADVGRLAGEAAVPVVAHGAVAAVSGALGVNSIAFQFSVPFLGAFSGAFGLLVLFSWNICPFSKFHFGAIFGAVFGHF